MSTRWRRRHHAKNIQGELGVQTFDFLVTPLVFRTSLKIFASLVNLFPDAKFFKRYSFFYYPVRSEKLFKYFGILSICSLKFQDSVFDSTHLLKNPILQK